MGKKNTDCFICTVTCDNACNGDTDYFFHMEDRAVSRRKMHCPRRISAARRNRFRYRKRKNQKRRKRQTGRTGSKTTQNRKKRT